MHSQFLSVSVVFLTLSSFSAANGCHNVKNFTQLVDHSNSFHAPNATFQQQYQLDTSVYKSGGPILFFQGNEGSQMFCIEELILPSWAKELGAAVATLEHRFFGESVPSNATDPVKRFETLTLDNVMSDSVNFIEWVKSTVPGAKDSKAIVQGASYGAALSSWLRLNHPDTFYGAISSAAPLRAFGFSATDPDNYNWMSWASRSIAFQSAEAAGRIKSAFEEFSKRTSTPSGLAGLQKDFNLCTAPNSSADAAKLLLLIRETYEFATQFNFANPQYPIGSKSIAIGYPIKTPLAVLMNRTLALDSKDAMGILNASLSLYMDQFGSCVDVGTGAPPVPAIESSVFAYISCTYLTISDAATPPGTIFPEVSLNVTVPQRDACEKAYNVTVPTQAQLQQRYRFTQEDIQNSTRLLIASGEFDPTSSISAKPWDYGPNANASRIMYVSEMGHCEDTYKHQAGDKESVVRARNYELQVIKEWLGC